MVRTIIYTRYGAYLLLERQKITRKIKQLKTQLASESSPEKPPLTDLENALYELRVDLNYVLVCTKISDIDSSTERLAVALPET